MMKMNLIKAIRAVEDYSNGEEVGVVLVGARSADIADRWFIIEGVRRAYRRVYVVDCSTPNGYVVEVVGGSQMDEADLITFAIGQRKS
jgi:hypothetical protein